MSTNQTNLYASDPHIAEIYDKVEDYSDDVEFLLSLIARASASHSSPLHILEPFCGTGRMLFPLAYPKAYSGQGSIVTGLDQAAGMLARAREKAARLPSDVRNRITLIESDVTEDEWPRGFDLVVLGCNCFYELATPQEQEQCVASAATSLKSGGCLFIDNDHMEGELKESWRVPGLRVGAFPTGTCEDGTRLESTSETIWFDAQARLVLTRRRTRMSDIHGNVTKWGFLQQKHPVSATELGAWLSAHGFVIDGFFGDYTGTPYDRSSPRAIFWARKL
jgi:SAM-dependent methyltransferase